MALPGFKMPSTPGGASGMEMMLRSLGMGEAIDAAKALAENGTIDKIIQFSEGLNELNNRLDRIEAAIIAGFASAASSDPGEVIPLAIRGVGAEPGSGSAASGHSDFADVASAGGAAASGHGRARAPRVGNGRSNGGASSEAPNDGGEE